MATILTICAVVWLLGTVFKGAFFVAGFVLKWTGILFVVLVGYYLILAMLGIPYH